VVSVKTDDEVVVIFACAAVKVIRNEKKPSAKQMAGAPHSIARDICARIRVYVYVYDLRFIRIAGDQPKQRLERAHLLDSLRRISCVFLDDRNARAYVYIVLNVCPCPVPGVIRDRAWAECSETA